MFGAARNPNIRSDFSSIYSCLPLFQNDITLVRACWTSFRKKSNFILLGLFKIYILQTWETGIKPFMVNTYPIHPHFVHNSAPLLIPLKCAAKNCFLKNRQMFCACFDNGIACLILVRL